MSSWLFLQFPFLWEPMVEARPAGNENLVDAFRHRFPTLTLATDVICGFPGENDVASKKTRTTFLILCHAIDNMRFSG
jgi:tRNA A37 methylthiotransferase MiaB